MRPVDRAEVLNIAEYELIRAELRPRMMALKDRRRVRAGDHLTFLFENRDTVLYQIQEMVRIERMVRAEDIAHEVETYNELIPGRNQLSACLLIEYDTPESRAVWLRELLSLEKHIWLAAGSTPPAPASFDTRQIATDRISAVQYLKFALSPEQAAAFAGGARIIVDHPKYRAEAVLTAGQLAELAGDLQSPA
jgi:hypothetical protein